MTEVSLIVIAKEPRAGVTKTRLCPPCTPEEAAGLAAAALADTLRNVAATPAARHVLALDGGPGSWIPPGFEVIQQRGDGLEHRLACAFEDVGGPALLIGMDTPQVNPPLLTHAIELLEVAELDAVLGPTFDGGYWAIGLREPDAEVFIGVPMSTSETGVAQQMRFAGLGIAYSLLPQLRDIDYFEDALSVAACIPKSLFARQLEALR